MGLWDQPHRVLEEWNWETRMPNEAMTPVAEDQAGAENFAALLEESFAEGGPESLTVLAQEAIAVEDLTAEDVSRQISEAEEALARENITDEERRYNETALQALSDLKK